MLYLKNCIFEFRVYSLYSLQLFPVSNNTLDISVLDFREEVLEGLFFISNIILSLYS
jgi:hypothetical protein